MIEKDQHQYKDRYMLRFPDGLRDRIKAMAKMTGRSMNAEIVIALEEKFPDPGSAKDLAEFVVKFAREQNMSLDGFAAADHIRIATERWYAMQTGEKS